MICQDRLGTDIQKTKTKVAWRSAPIYVHLCFQAVHTPYDAPPVGWRGPPLPPDLEEIGGASSTSSSAGQSCADAESWYTDTEFNCPSPAVHAAGVVTAAACCSACGSNCTHWTFMGGQCTQWGGKNCKRVASQGATSANLKHNTPGPSPPGPPAQHDMPVYHQMLWDADLYVGRLVSAVKTKGMWENSIWVYSADNGGTNSGINWPLRGEKHTNWVRPPERSQTPNRSFERLEFCF